MSIAQSHRAAIDSFLHDSLASDVREAWDSWCSDFQPDSSLPSPSIQSKPGSRRTGNDPQLEKNFISDLEANLKANTFSDHELSSLNHFPKLHSKKKTGYGSRGGHSGSGDGIPNSDIPKASQPSDTDSWASRAAAANGPPETQQASKTQQPITLATLQATIDRLSQQVIDLTALWEETEARASALDALNQQLMAQSTKIIEDVSNAWGFSPSDANTKCSRKHAEVNTPSRNDTPRKGEGAKKARASDSTELDTVVHNLDYGKDADLSMEVGSSHSNNNGIIEPGSPC